MTAVQLPAAPCLPPGLRLWWLPHPRRSPGEPAVRRLLSEQWRLPADRIPLLRGEHGRPQLQAPFAHLDASWSHSGDHLLLALGEAMRLGVDLEWLKPRPRLMQLAARFFHAEEAAWLQAQAGPRRELSFVRLWCAKEAVLKAHGQGVSFGLHRLRFAAAGTDVDAALVLQACDPRLGRPGDWTLREWAPLPAYRAALAWRGRQP